MASLSGVFKVLQRGSLKNMLEGAGITLATSGTVLVAVNTAIDQFKNSLNGVSATLLQLAGLCGFDVAFSLVLGAIATRYIQNSAKLFLARK